MVRFIETPRLFITVPTLADVDNWQIIHSDLETMRYLGGICDRETTIQWLTADMTHYNKHGFCLGSVFDKESKCFLGIAGLVYLNYDDSQTDIEIGYQLRKDCWGKGYATELVEALINWGCDHLNVTRLVAVTRPENEKSRHVLEKTGMTCAGNIQLHNSDYLLYTVNNKNKYK